MSFAREDVSCTGLDLKLCFLQPNEHIKFASFCSTDFVFCGVDVPGVSITEKLWKMAKKKELVRLWHAFEIAFSIRGRGVVNLLQISPANGRHPVFMSMIDLLNLLDEATRFCRAKFSAGNVTVLRGFLFLRFCQEAIEKDTPVMILILSEIASGKTYQSSFSAKPTMLILDGILSFLDSKNLTQLASQVPASGISRMGLPSTIGGRCDITSLDGWYTRLDIESACPQTNIIEFFFIWSTKELISGLEMLSISPSVARKGSGSPMRMSLGYPAPGRGSGSIFKNG